MNLLKLEKKIQRQKSKIEKMQSRRDKIRKEEEEKAQSPVEQQKKKKGKQKEKALTEEEKVREVQHSYMRCAPLFYAERKSLKEFLAPDAIDPNNYGYLKIEDAGRDVYERAFYIDKMPRNATFATTFADLYNFKNVTSNTRIEPISNEKAIHLLDRQVIDLDTELATARKNGDRNRTRKISRKMSDAEGWASDLEGGRNKLFNVSFIYNTYGKSLKELNDIGTDFHTKALGKNMSVVSCYGVEPEAFKSGFPLNQLFKSKYGPVSTSTAKVHQMDTYSLATIFNHTRSKFYHKNGVYLGRNLSAPHQPVTIDFYDPSLEAHNVIVSGKTGTGKSATIKIILSRASDFGLKFCSIDSEARGKYGEYYILTKRLGGVNFQIKVDSEEIVNLFEISAELEYDEATGQEEWALHLIDKISILKGIIMTMITFGKKEPSFEDATALSSIIGDIIAYLYEIRGIREGDSESLFAITSGYAKVKKPLPTISEFFIEALKRQRDNQNPDHKKAYSILLDSMKDYVKELYYIPKIIKILNKEEYEALPCDEEGKHYYENGGERIFAVKVKGTRSYYDGESTIKVDLDMPAINIDISQLPANDRPIAMVIACNFLNENIIKKNSANPKRVQKRAILIDEVHRLFRYKELREFLSDLYRSARKRFVAPISSTQALADYKGYEETETIVKESPIIFLLRQARQDREYLERATCLTPAQMDRMLTLGGREKEDGSAAEKGQVCLIVNNRVVFVQVDYLKWSEADIVETDMKIIHDHIRQRRSKQYVQTDGQ